MGSTTLALLAIAVLQSSEECNDNPEHPTPVVGDPELRGGGQPTMPEDERAEVLGALSGLGHSTAAGQIAASVSSGQLTLVKLRDTGGDLGEHDYNTIGVVSGWGTAAEMSAQALLHEWEHLTRALQAGTTYDPATFTGGCVVKCACIDGTEKEALYRSEPCGACDHAEMMAEGANELAELTHAPSSVTDPAEFEDLCKKLRATNQGIDALFDACEDGATSEGEACAIACATSGEARPGSGCSDADYAEHSQAVSEATGGDGEAQEKPERPSDDEQTEDCCEETIGFSTDPSESEDGTPLPDEGGDTATEGSSDGSGDTDADEDGQAQQHAGDGEPEDDDDPCPEEEDPGSSGGDDGGDEGEGGAGR